MRRVFGRRLKAARRKKGWTQQEFSYRVGVSRVTVSRWERGEGAPSDAGILLDTSDALCVSLRWLLGRTDAAEVPVHLNYQEIELIRLFRAIPPSARQLLLESFREAAELQARIKRPD